MTASGSQAAPPTRAAAHTRRATKVPAPLRLLAVVDGSERTNRVIDYIVTLAQGREAIEVLLLNVQSKSHDARLRGYQTFRESEVDDRLINDLGAPIVGSASRMLDKVHIQHRSKVLIGDPVQTILRCAAEEDCDSIVIGNHRSKGITGLISATLGSSPVLRLLAIASIPVVVVK
jgi:nucleotide-binding universal stress UspA family protein